MKKILRYNRSAIAVSILALMVFLLSECIPDSQIKNDEEQLTNSEGEQFAGSATCTNCHRDIYDDHIRTAHFLTSQPATDEYVKGSFETGKNAFYFNKSVAVAMEKRDNGFYQVEYFRGEEKKHAVSILLWVQERWDKVF